ncbi:MAG: glycosyltransferase involved in cell wall biosynthesis, partial [Planctomycetota bacterium]
MRILAAEPYAAPSHSLFLEGLAKHSSHDIQIESLPARSWKWRMRTASIHFAQILENDGPWDLLFASDFLNLAETLALLSSSKRQIPTVAYFHENQLTYPLQAGEELDVHHALTHIHTILASECTLFNSFYHRDSFIAAASELLKKVPDVAVSRVIPSMREKCSVLPLGIELSAGAPAPPTQVPTILWPHRWEYDKDPATFLSTLIELDQQGIEFRLRLAGQRFRTQPPELKEIKTRFADRIEPDEFLDRDAHLQSLARIIHEPRGKTPRIGSCWHFADTCPRRRPCKVVEDASLCKVPA